MINTEVMLDIAHRPARDQGRRPTCIAFALADAQLRTAPQLEALSAEYLYQVAAFGSPEWQPHSGVALDAAIRAVSLGLPEEEEYPYQAEEPSAPLVEPTLEADMHGIRMDYSSVDADRLVSKLRLGDPVGLGLRLTDTFFSPTEGLIAFNIEALPNELHAVLAVGLGWAGDDAHLYIRNSWGPGWGQNGCAWISMRYILEHGLCLMELQDG